MKIRYLPNVFSAKGFTLIELLVVIALIGVLAAGVIVTINPLAKINSANLAKVKTFSKSVENSISAAQVGKWSFEDAVTSSKDTSGNGNNGTWNGAVVRKDAATCGLGFGGCLSFNGSSYVNVADSSSLNITNGTITIGAWINISAYPSVSEEYSYIVIRSGPSYKQYRLMLYQNKTVDGAFLDGINWGNGMVQSVSTLALNTWYYVVYTYDGAVHKIYINGVLGNTKTAAGGVSFSGALTIGGVSGSRRFNGLIDEVQIYSQSLSASNIQQLYAQGLLKHLVAFNIK